MGRISKRRLHSLIEERIYQIFWEHLASLSTPTLVAEFLRSLLSHTEQLMLAKRLAIAILLSRGHNYQKIDDALKVSKATIATVDRQMITGASGFEKAVQGANKRKAKEALWDSLEEVLLRASMPARVGSARHRIKSVIGKDLYNKKLQRSVL